MNRTSEKKLGEFITDLLRYQLAHPTPLTGVDNVTEEEIDDFIKLFLERTPGVYNHCMTSYGLKHCCERAIGHIMRRGEGYAYVNNDQMKEAMHRAYFKARPNDDENINEIYQFRFRPGAIALFHQLGVYGTLQFKPLTNDQ